ncbi:TonB-dependent receptor domain-containing protein [Sphingosinicella sp. BN140058]|uniref:TonB-dependent receptor domain-containing protein n=1 Tax=Sphingosinicella sp. BN140058 TaxID=1892855 RepID=UPI0010115253|nr:TonB-dependent receptor [Sphingosinicella sp. BN140058]QAY75276.1 TonB-dependent receptor [Sphingosinicella sp. BN140058]
MRYRSSILAAAAVGFIVSPAPAQPVSDNATTEAKDAFGSTVGAESLGIYSPADVRGFSPTVAGNIRIEGLYFDRQAEFTGRLVAGNRIHVGPSALGYLFPAPSGIADYRLREPGAQPALTLMPVLDTFGGARLEADASLPLVGERLGIAAGIGLYANRSADGRTGKVVSLAAVGQGRPLPGLILRPFWSRIRIDDDQVAPILLGDGLSLPPRLRRDRGIGQSWAAADRERLTYGLIADADAGAFLLRGGLFRSADRSERSFSLFQQAAPLGTWSARAVTADPPRMSASTSGELRLSRRFDAAGAQHLLTIAARGRRQQRVYGGGDRRALPDVPFGSTEAVAKPDFAFTTRTRDEVEQRTYGVRYRAMLPGRGELDLGLQHTDYRKRVSPPGAAPIVAHDRLWLFNAAATVEIASGLAVYAGTSRGLEEAQIAPETAVNRDEAPPAIRTRQVDGGFRWHAAPGFDLVAGLFSIAKPYDGLDASNRFRRLGSVRHRGVEASLTASPGKGLTLVAGAVLLDASLSGDERLSGQIGARPIGTPSHLLQASLDWRPASASPWSFDIVATHSGPEFADRLNRVRLAPVTTVDLGLRYRFALGAMPATLRLHLLNATNGYGWDVVGSNAFRPAAPRQLFARLIVDL